MEFEEFGDGKLCQRAIPRLKNHDSKCRELFGVLVSCDEVIGNEAKDILQEA